MIKNNNLTKDLSGQLHLGTLPIKDVLFINTGEYSNSTLALLGLTRKEYDTMRVSC